MRKIMLIIFMIISIQANNRTIEGLKIIEKKEVIDIQCFNNNPFNLRGNDNWVGSLGLKNGFQLFSGIEYGIRAGLINLKNQTKKHNIRSVRKLIEKYAPPCENDTEKYIRILKEELGKGTIDLTDMGDLIKVSSIISKLEGTEIEEKVLLMIINKFKI